MTKSTFTAASQIPRRIAKITTAQPGYRRGAQMCWHPRGRLYRLFVDVAGQWMDASLQDVDLDYKKCPGHDWVTQSYKGYNVQCAVCGKRV
jgi:hypothetical protein